LGIYLTGSPTSASVLASLVGQTVTADNFIATASAINFTTSSTGRIYFGAGSDYLTRNGATGLLTYTSGYASGIASGNNAFLASVAGARIKLSTGGTSDYFISDGSNTISTPGDFFAGTNMGATVIRAGIGAQNYINLHTSAGINVNAGASNLVIIGPTRTEIQGTVTTPAKSAFHVLPQGAQPTGPNIVGDLYVTTAGVLKICTVAGSPGTWVSVGAQT
jgi:hypothetical protein